MTHMFDKFLQYTRYERNLSPLTVKAYGSDLRQFGDFLTGGKRPLEPHSVTASDVRAWMVDLSRHHDGARTMRRKIQALRAYYKWLLRRGDVAADPTVGIELAKLPKVLPCYVRESTLDALLDSPVDTADYEAVRDRLIVMMLYDTGMRRAELIGLRDAAVDTARCELKVHGKRDKDRIVPFGPELARAITRYRQLRDKQVARGCEAFFLTAKGAPLYPSLVYRVVHRALQQAGGTGKLSPHVLRHSFASAMLNNGADIDSVKQLLGHESLAATQVYTHITFSELINNYKHAHPRALKKGG